MSAWQEIVEVTVGVPYGHVAGHDWHDVSVTIETRETPQDHLWRVVILETWGHSPAQENGRARVVALADNLESAVKLAGARARTANVDARFLVQALSEAHATALDDILGEDSPRTEGATNVTG